MAVAIKALAACGKNKHVEPFEYRPRALCAHDVVIDITHCGVCASDVHQVDNDWKLPQRRPLVPGHEVVGVVTKAGPAAAVSVGARVGVSPQVGACGRCKTCGGGNPQYCRKMVDIYQGVHAESGARTYGGFSERMVVDSRWVYPLPESLPSVQAAPLLCAGLTVYSPLRRYAKPGHRVGVLGIGGLGHLAVQFASAMGCRVTAISHSPDKEEFARSLGAEAFVSSSDRPGMRQLRGELDVLLVTINVKINWAELFQLMALDGTICLVGVPTENVSVRPFQLLMSRVALVGSLLASPSEIREMLELAGKRGIKALVTELPMSRANDALQRVRQGKPRFRDVLVQDLSTQSKL